MKGKKLLYGLIPLVLIGGLIAYVAYRTRPVPIPGKRWKRFHRPGVAPLDAETCLELQGIYSISEGCGFFWAHGRDKMELCRGYEIRAGRCVRRKADP